MGMSEKETDDGEAFVRLLMEHEPSVRAFLRGLLPGWNDVDEVIQNASMIAWRKFDQFERGTAFGGWFLTIARFEALKHRRKLARTPMKFDDDLWNVLAEEAAVRQQDIRLHHLETCLERIQPQQKALLLKTHAPKAVIREIALQSGKSEQGFYKMIQRLRSSVMDCVSRLSSLEQG
jgi:RNA polymerase sigma-70 factor (ECF subfamily)